MSCETIAKFHVLWRALRSHANNGTICISNFHQESSATFAYTIIFCSSLVGLKHGPEPRTTPKLFFLLPRQRPRRAWVQRPWAQDQARAQDHRLLTLSKAKAKAALAQDLSPRPGSSSSWSWPRAGPGPRPNAFSSSVFSKKKVLWAQVPAHTQSMSGPLRNTQS